MNIIVYGVSGTDNRNKKKREIKHWVQNFHFKKKDPTKDNVITSSVDV